jgi:hypothetical protein
MANYFGRIRLQIGAEAGIAVGDTLDCYYKLSLKIDLQLESSLNRIINQSSAIQRFTGNYQSANIRAWKEASKLIVNSESLILNTNYTTEMSIHGMENSLNIVHKNSRKVLILCPKSPERKNKRSCNRHSERIKLTEALIPSGISKPNREEYYT